MQFPFCFSDCSAVENTNIITELIVREFVVFNVEYRRGRLLQPQQVSDNFRGATVQQILGFYRAFQDARGAIRSIIKRQYNETSGDIHNDPYRILTDYIFLAGQSAGSAIALNAAYYTTQAAFDNVFGTAIKDPDILNGIDVNYYYGSTNNPGYDYYPRITGVLNMWGNVFLPYSFATNIPQAFYDYLRNAGNNGTLPPMISFHGKNDRVAFLNSAPVAYSRAATDGGKFYTETRCLINANASFSLSPDNSNFELLTVGSSFLYQTLIDQGVFTELYIDCDAQHGLRNPGPDGFYGTNLFSPTDANVYIAKRATTFFQAILVNKTTGLGDTKFVDCVNTRYGKGGTATNSCSGDKECN